MREAVDGPDRPNSSPPATFSILRALIPLTYALETTPTIARSTREYGRVTSSGKYVSSRNLGTRSTISPITVRSLLSR